MKVTGFTIVKNAIQFGYPIVESINSILPICDEFVIGVGQSDDDTLALIQSIQNPKIKIIETVWQETYEDGGQVLAVETDKVFQKIDTDTTWCFYLQADEIVHEKYLDSIKAAMSTYEFDAKVDGLLFNYLHFFHSFNYVGASSRFYDREIRIFKNDKSIYAYRDAQGFRKENNKKLNVKRIEAFIYHYGWVRPPEKMYNKMKTMMTYYHDQAYIDKVLYKDGDYDYAQWDAYLVPFEGTHPKLMQKHAEAMDWDFDLSLYRKSYSVKDHVKMFLRKYTPINPYYANYKLV